MQFHCRDSSAADSLMALVAILEFSQENSIILEALKKNVYTKLSLPEIRKFIEHKIAVMTAKIIESEII
jgi:hypothetical protein